MFGLGLIKGTIIGVGIGVVTGLAIKEICKMKKLNNQKDKTEYKDKFKGCILPDFNSLLIGIESISSNISSGTKVSNSFFKVPS